MNTGQMLLVIGGLALLSKASLSMTHTMLDGDRAALETQAGILAVGLAQTHIEALEHAGFDSVAVGTVADSSFTPFAAFACTTRVHYVTLDNPDQSVAGPTPLKGVEVQISSDHLPGQITLHTLLSEY